jgi:putative membrane protein
VALAGLALAVPAHAHVDTAAAPGWNLHWSFEPWVLACLALSAAGYGLGLWRLWRSAGTGRGVTRAQAWAFAGGWLALVVALVSPLDPLGVQLFSAHMLQHELMMVVAAPLLCVARPLVLWTWALPPPARRTVGRWTRQPRWRACWHAITAPVSTWVLHALALWGWHLPSLFDAALRDNGVHTLQHLGFLGSALLFWWSALKPATRQAQGRALLYLFTTMLHTGALGALLTLAPTVWYPSYLPTTAALGIDALEDQQLGGLVMWVPAGLAYFASGLLLAARWSGLGGPRGRAARINARGSSLPPARSC